MSKESNQTEIVLKLWSVLSKQEVIYQMHQSSSLDSRNHQASTYAYIAKTFYSSAVTMASKEIIFLCSKHTGQKLWEQNKQFPSFLDSI